MLGRRVEEATLAVVREAAQQLGARTLLGRYRPTAKNAMVREHYPRLGFEPAPGEGEDARYRLSLAAAAPADPPMVIERV